MPVSAAAFLESRYIEFGAEEYAGTMKNFVCRLKISHGRKIVGRLLFETFPCTKRHLSKAGFLDFIVNQFCPVDWTSFLVDFKGRIKEA